MWDVQGSLAPAHEQQGGRVLWREQRLYRLRQVCVRLYFCTTVPGTYHTLHPCTFRSTALCPSHFLAQHLNRVAKRIHFASPPPAIISFSSCTVTAATPSFGTSERARRCGRYVATDVSSTVWRATHTTPSWLQVASTTLSNCGPHARHRHVGRKGGGRGTPRACPTKPATDPHWPSHSHPMSIHWRRCLSGTQPH